MERELNTLRELKEDLSASNNKLQKKFDTELMAKNSMQEQEE